MPALVKSRLGASGMSDDDGTMVCCFSRKKSRNDCRICAEVINPKLSATSRGMRELLQCRRSGRTGQGGDQCERFVAFARCMHLVYRSSMVGGARAICSRLTTLCRLMIHHC